MTGPPTAAECTTEAEATAGMGTAARMTRVRAAAKNAFTEPPSTALENSVLEINHVTNVTTVLNETAASGWGSR